MLIGPKNILLFSFKSPKNG